MKKIITITAVLFTAAFISSSAFAWWGGGMMGHDNDGRHYTNSTDRQAFYEATQDLRASLAADQAELDAVLAKDNPDSAKIKTLTQKIVKQQDQLRAQAEKFNASTADDNDYCPGYGHGYGHGGGHMMN